MTRHGGTRATDHADPLIVSCGNCLSRAGSPCIGERGLPLRKPHRERLVYADFVAAERARMNGPRGV